MNFSDRRDIRFSDDQLITPRTMIGAPCVSVLAGDTYIVFIVAPIPLNCWRSAIRSRKQLPVHVLKYQQRIARFAYRRSLPVPLLQITWPTLKFEAMIR